MTISFKQVTMALLILSAFVQPIIAFTTTAIGSILVMTIVVTGFFYALSCNACLTKGFLFTLLSVLMYSFFLYFMHRMNPFSLGILSLIYVSIFLSILLEGYSTEQKYRWLVRLYSVHIIYIVLECVLILSGFTNVLDVITNSTFRYDYNQLHVYLSLGIANISSQSLFLMPNASGILLVLFTFLVLLSPKIEASKKVMTSVPLVFLFVLFALNGSAMLVIGGLVLGKGAFYLMNGKFFSGTIKKTQFLMLPLKLILLIAACVSVYVFLKLKVNYHPHMSADELHEVTENIYLDTYWQWQSQGIVAKLFGVGLEKASRLMEYGDCLVGNILLKFGVNIFVFLIIFFVQLLWHTVRTLLYFKNNVSHNGRFVCYMVLSNFLIFAGWLLTILHYGVVVVLPGLTLASFSAAIVISTAAMCRDVYGKQPTVGLERFNNQLQGTF